MWPAPAISTSRLAGNQFAKPSAITRVGDGACSPRRISTGNVSAAIGARRRRIVDQGAEVERSLGRPADQGTLHRRPQRVPAAGPVPVVDKAGNGSPIVAGDDALADAPGDARDLGVGRRAPLTHLAQQVKRRRLVERHAGDAVRPGQRHVERDATAVGVPDEVNLVVAPVDQRDGLARPRRRA